MEKTKLVLKSLILLFAILVCRAPALALPIISLAPTSATIALNSSFDVRVNISAVTDLYGYQFDLQYNPAILAANSVTEGLFLSAGGATFFIPGSINNAAGAITFTSDVLLTAVNGVSGSGTLATVNFKAIAKGTSPLSLSNVELLDSSFNDIAFSTTGSSVTVDGIPKIPEVNSGVLLSFGLFGMVMLRKVGAHL